LSPKMPVMRPKRLEEISVFWIPSLTFACGTAPTGQVSLIVRGVSP
jgi:hypothetical protein